jgi:UDP-N-acetylmuramate dehydrogenase
LNFSFDIEIMVSLDEITKFFRGNIKLSQPLANFTTFRIGGPADYYLEPTDKDDAVKLINYLQANAFPFMIIGNASNLLISDEGYHGAVINLESTLGEVRKEGEYVVSGAGARLAKFVDFCVQRGLGGVEMLAGIPGTVGGAIIMNAGAYGGEISDFLVDVEVLRQSNLVWIKKEEGGFLYRRSGFGRDVVLGARFLLPRKDKTELMRVRRELLVKRNLAQPVNFPNAGSIFKNPPGNHAAKLIESAGLKGLRRGGAQISERHGNFIINLGNARATDVLDLIREAQRTVFEKSKVQLELEVKLIGFNGNDYRAVA